MPLYDILNEFQKGGSHMAAVVATKQRKRKFSGRTSQKEERNGAKEYQVAEADIEKGAVKAPGRRDGANDGEPSCNTEYEQLKEGAEYTLENGDKQKPDVEEGDVIGIITMEDVMEELLQVPFFSTSSSNWSFFFFLVLFCFVFVFEQMNRIHCKRVIRVFSHSN
jgi:metal transporter CNNM